MKYVSQFFFDLESNLMEFSKIKEFDLDELKCIITFYKKMLNYHNKKEAVHSISYSVDDYVNIYEENLYKVLTEPLTGESSLDDIKNIIYKVEHLPAPSDLTPYRLVDRRLVELHNVGLYGVSVAWRFLKE